MALQMATIDRVDEDDEDGDNDGRLRHHLLLLVECAPRATRNIHQPSSAK